MKIFKREDYLNIKNPTPGENYRPEISMTEFNARQLGGMFGLLVPGGQVPYHYHKSRESIVIPISGEAIEIVEGKEYPIKVGDVLYIPAGEKHTAVNRSDEDFRFLEFYTDPPLSADFIEVKE